MLPDLPELPEPFEWKPIPDRTPLRWWELLRRKRKPLGWQPGFDATQPAVVRGCGPPRYLEAGDSFRITEVTVYIKLNFQDCEQMPVCLDCETLAKVFPHVLLAALYRYCVTFPY